MRKRLLAMSGSLALGIAVASSGAMPTGAIQLAQGQGLSEDAHVIQIQDRGRGQGGSGPQAGGRGSLNIQGSQGGGRGAGMQGGFQTRQGTPGFAARGSGDFQGRGQVGHFRSRGEVQDRRDVRRDFQRRDFDARVYSRREGDWRWKDAHAPRLVHKGWDRHHRHRFLGAFLFGIPFGYAAITAHPCYDWTYGPYGWGYYWNYDRCPV
jgi:hypothetical protein